MKWCREKENHRKRGKRERASATVIIEGTIKIIGEREKKNNNIYLLHSHSFNFYIYAIMFFFIHIFFSSLVWKEKKVKYKADRI